MKPPPEWEWDWLRSLFWRESVEGFYFFFNPWDSRDGRTELVLVRDRLP